MNTSTFFLWILLTNFAQIIVEIDKHVMFTYYSVDCGRCGRCELFDSVYLYAKSQVLIEMVIR